MFSIWEVLWYCIYAGWTAGGVVYVVMSWKLSDVRMDYQMLRHRYRIITGEKP